MKQKKSGTQELKKKNELVSQILESSGFIAALNSLPEQFRSYALEKQATSENPEIDKIIAEIFVSAYDQKCACRLW